MKHENPVLDKHKKPRVLLLGSLPPPYGGMAMVVKQYLQSNVPNHFDIKFVPGDILNKLVHTGIYRIILNIINTALLIPLFIWSLLWTRPDIVHIHSTSYMGFYEKAVLVLLARLTRAKVVMHIHAGSFRVFFEESPLLFKKLIRLCLSLNHNIMVLSAEMRQLFLEIGVKPEKITIIENAVFLPEKKAQDYTNDTEPSHKQSGDAITILFLNRILKTKGILEFIDAAEIVCSHLQNTRFLIAGSETSICQTVRERIAEKNLTDRVRLIGEVLGKAKENTYLNADIYVLPSYREGMPIGLLEAMSYGLPCIVTAVGGIPNIIENEVNGIFIPPKDSKALAEAIEKLCIETTLRQQIGMQARSIIENKLSWDICARKTVDLYNKLLSG